MQCFSSPTTAHMGMKWEEMNACMPEKVAVVTWVGIGSKREWALSSNYFELPCLSHNVSESHQSYAASHSSTLSPASTTLLTITQDDAMNKTVALPRTHAYPLLFHIGHRIRHNFARSKARVFRLFASSFMLVNTVAEQLSLHAVTGCWWCTTLASTSFTVDNY